MLVVVVILIHLYYFDVVDRQSSGAVRRIGIDAEEHPQLEAGLLNDLDRQDHVQIRLFITLVIGIGFDADFSQVADCRSGRARTVRPVGAVNCGRHLDRTIVVEEDLSIRVRGIGNEAGALSSVLVGRREYDDLSVARLLAGLRNVFRVVVLYNANTLIQVKRLPARVAVQKR